MPCHLRPRSSMPIALLLMLSSVGLLIAPSAFHRIVDRGESTGRTLVHHIVLRRCEPAAVRRRTRDRPYHRADAHFAKLMFSVLPQGPVLR